MRMILKLVQSMRVYVVLRLVGKLNEIEISISYSILAPHMSLLPSVICDCVGLDRYTTAFGILFLFRGVTSIIGPPAAGLF
jgi:hypothetical protein